MAADQAELDALRTLLEKELLIHFDYVKATHATKQEPAQLAVPNMLQGWVGMKKGLEALAFAPDSNCPWSRLGMSKLEGPPPSLDQIERRARLARNLLDAWHGRSWEDKDVHAAKRCLDDIEAARQSCCVELPRALRSRNKIGGGKLPRWQEPSPELLDFLHSRIKQSGEKWKLAIHFSNVQKIDFQTYPGALPPLSSRPLAEALCSSPSQA